MGLVGTGTVRGFHPGITGSTLGDVEQTNIITCQLTRVSVGAMSATHVTPESYVTCHIVTRCQTSRLFRSEGKTLSLRVTTSSFLNISNPNLSAQLFIFLYLLKPQLTLALVQFDRY